MRVCCVFVIYIYILYVVSFNPTDTSCYFLDKDMGFSNQLEVYSPSIISAAATTKKASYMQYVARH